MADFVRITLMQRGRPGSGFSKQGSYIDHVCNVNMIDMLDGAEENGDYYMIEAVNMTDEEFNKLPEFEGF